MKTQDRCASPPLRFVIYGAVLAYLVCDLYFCGGPLGRHLRPTAPNSPPDSAPADPIVARVAAYNIHRSQLERGLRERLWLEGKSLATLSPAERSCNRQAALDDLIDHELLRTKAAASATELNVSDAEITGRLNRFSAGFSNQQELAAAMAAQGISGEQELRERLAARIQQEKFVESRLAPLVGVSDEEARQWFEKNQGQLVTPERLEVRHIFLPTLEQDPDAVKQTLVGVLAVLRAGSKDFATLAREISEDPLTKDHGGSLGWTTRERLPAELAAPLFAMPLHQPSLLRSKLGWHLIEVTARKPAEPATFERAKPEILDALAALKRRQAASEYREALRRFEASNIEIHPERAGE